MNKKMKDQALLGSYISVKIEDLIVNEENPRHEIAKDEKEAIFKMLKIQNEKIFNLAEDIINNGLSPVEIISGFKINNKYTVIEGNRRITALKIIKYPYALEIVKIYKKSLYDRFVKLIESLEEELPDEITIYTHPNLLYLKYLMEQRHLGENNGRGLTKWGKHEKQRYALSVGRKSPLVNFLDMLVQNNYASEEDAFTNINLTNWERILGSIGQKELKIKFVDNQYIITDNDLFKKKISFVVAALRNQPVKIVYDNEAIEDFFKEVNNKFEITNDLKTCKRQDYENSFFDGKIQKDNSDIQNTNETKLKEQKNVAMHLNRDTRIIENKYAILKCTKIPETEFRILYLYKEVKSISKSQDYKKYPLATLFLIRSLFEQCIKYYCEKQAKPIKTTSQKGRDLPLSEIIKTMLKQNPFKFFGDSQLDRAFETFFSNESTSKDILDIFMHHTKYFSGNYNEILPVINGIIFNVINHVLNNEINVPKDKEI